MDVFGIVNIPSWIIVFIVTFYVCYLYVVRNYGTFESLGVPGPKPWPLIGNVLEDLFYVIQDKDISNTKKYGRIYGYWELTKPTLRVTDPALLKEVLVKNFSNFTDRRHFDTGSLDPIMAKMMSFMRGDEWKMTRNVMSPTFTSGKLKQMVNLVDKCSQRLVNQLAAKADTGESLDAKNMYISYLLEIVGTCAFGVETNAKSSKKNDKSFVDYAKRLVFARRMITIFLTMLLPRKVSSALNVSFMDVDALNCIKKMLLVVMKARESGKERRNDFMQLMMDALKEANSKGPTDRQMLKESNLESEDPDQEKRNIKAVLTQDGVIAQSILFLLAGFETTSTTLCFASYMAATNPENQDKLIEEVDRILAQNQGKINWETISQMTYMDMFIAETLRKYPQTIRIDRQCTRDTQIGALRIRKGTIVNALIYAIHHDEEFYPDPEKFDPERFSAENKELRDPYTYLAFGMGPRNCIGMRFALMEVKLTLIHMLKNFRFCRSPRTRVNENGWRTGKNHKTVYQFFALHCPFKEPLAFKRGHMMLTPIGGTFVTLSSR